MCCRRSFNSPPGTHGVVQLGVVLALMMKLCRMWAFSDDPSGTGIMKSSTSKESWAWGKDVREDILFLADTFHTGLATLEIYFLHSCTDLGLLSPFLEFLRDHWPQGIPIAFLHFWQTVSFKGASSWARNAVGSSGSFTHEHSCSRMAVASGGSPAAPARSR